jgi:uncharacterized protein (DUF362 family)
MLNPNEIIEENIGTEFIEFEKEVERLSQEQLEQINVEASIYTSDVIYLKSASRKSHGQGTLRYTERLSDTLLP